MKNLILSLLLLMTISTIALSQDNFVYTVNVLGNKSRPQDNIKVWLEEKNTHKRIEKRTGSDGVVMFSVPPGYWSLNLIGMENYQEFTIKEGRMGQGSVTLSYDLERIKAEQAIIDKRRKMEFTEVDQTKIKPASSSNSLAIVKLKLEDASKSPVKKIPVDLVSVKQAKIYKTVTDNYGIATFQVPTGEIYAIDVDGIKNYNFTSNLFRPGTLTIENEYEPTDIDETINNDTITQKLSDDAGPTSARVYLEMTVSGAEEGDNVYMQQILSNRVYKAKTDNEGKVIFLLPKGEKYMLHFDYQKDVDVFNYTTAKGRGKSKVHVAYNPDPKLKYPERYIPTPENLYIEEFQNFITKTLPEPEDKKVGLFVKWGNNIINQNSKEAVLEIGVSGTNQQHELENTPDLELAFVIDRSGSMAGYDRIESLKETMIEFTGKLRPSDMVSLVTFNSTAFVDIPLKKKSGGSELKTFISEIEPGGGTNIYNGLVMGYEQLMQSTNANAIKQLILLTDGYGETEPNIVVEKSKEYNQKGIGISAIGVGSDYNYALLSLLTQEQGGLLEHAGESKDIYKAFEQQFSKLIYPIAKDAKLEIIFNDKIKYKQLFGIPLKSKSNDRVSVELGSLYMGFNKTIISLFDLNKPDKSIEKQPVIIELTYTDMQTNKLVKESQKASLEWSEETGKYELLLEQEQKKLFAIAIMNQSIKVMVEAFASNDFPRARYTLDRAFDQLKELYPEVNDKDIEKLAATMANYSKAIDNAIRKEKIEGR